MIGWMSVGELSPNGCSQLERGVVPLLVWTQLSTTLVDFVTLWLIWGRALGPLEA